MTSQPTSSGHDGLLDSFLRDLRYASRRLRNNWGFTSLAVLTLAFVVGILGAVVSSLFPALRTSGAGITHDLVTRGDVGGHGRIWAVLVATQVAMAFLLLVGCGVAGAQLPQGDQHQFRLSS